MTFPTEVGIKHAIRQTVSEPVIIGGILIPKGTLVYTFKRRNQYVSIPSMKCLLRVTSL